MYKLPNSKSRNTLRITGNLPIDPGLQNPGETPPPSPRTPRTPSVSRKDAIGHVFGDPITNLVPGRKPKKCEVIKLWMHLYDQVSFESDTRW